MTVALWLLEADLQNKFAQNLKNAASHLTKNVQTFNVFKINVIIEGFE